MRERDLAIAISWKQERVKLFTGDRENEVTSGLMTNQTLVSAW